ncbi:MAG TPA: RNA methyltransferase [Bacteroidales bacterium]|nr:RNA methyltransferase [Bacteroidales bacterium]
MLSQAKQKWIRSLEQKKIRQEQGLFLAEGSKCCTDLLELLPCRFLAATPDWLEAHKNIHAAEIIDATPEEIRKASLLKNPQDVLAVFEIPRYELTPEQLKGQLTLTLDNVQDPGNLGTILRIADWFGIRNVLCSIGTADAFNPKTVQATMGAIGRIHLQYTDLTEFLKTVPLPIYGTFLDGQVLYDAELKMEGIIVMGNEGNGISNAVENLVTDRLFIPDFPMGQTGSESLNVSVATAIVCSEFRRRALPNYLLGGA